MRRHAFEPARLLLGLALLVIAPVYVLAATGRWDVPLPVLLPLVPAALLLAGITRAGAYFARCAARTRRGRTGGGHAP
ncbi:hypothetical protein CUT44_26795 [Streptomyces carminius]|uniref:Uncharacterized protein n=1 Tax=Streptomyces carminius TaxID=2665496 RepID=A0A2M8LS52_9ACTN|nr:hypothetical protein [Streptomyces carminius]PJE94767.1 hypothetical protein CUT44_26795 [Streptomyces carminius]